MEIIRMPRLRGEFYINNCCYYDCMATICNYYGENIKWILYDWLNIKYAKDGIGQACFKLNFEENIEARMQEYFGIETDYQIFDTDILDKMKVQLKKDKKIVVKINSYWCPWDHVYHIAGCEDAFRHYFIIESYADEINSFICVDPYYNRVDGKISYEEFLKGYQAHVLIGKTRYFLEVKKDDVLLTEQLAELRRMDYWKDLYSFSNDLYKEIKEIFAQGENKKYWEDLHSVMRRMKYRCYYFACYIVGIEEYKNTKEYDALVDFSMNIYDQWAIIDSLIMKNILKADGECIVEKIRDRMIEAISQEYQLVQKLISFT